MTPPTFNAGAAFGGLPLGDAADSDSGGEWDENDDFADLGAPRAPTTAGVPGAPPPFPEGFGNAPPRATLLGGPRPAVPTAIGHAPPPPPLGQLSSWGEEPEEEQTTIYSGPSLTQQGVQTGTWNATLGGAPPPMSRPPHSLPAPAAPSQPISTLPPHLMPGAGSSRASMYVAGVIALLTVVAASLILILRTGKGELVVTVSGPGNEELESVGVLLDGQEVCSQSPCRIEGLEAGAHTIKARANGYRRTADTAISIASGAKAVHNIRLEKEADTGIKVSAEGKGLKLFLDGQEAGPLPQELTALAPGEHHIKVGGNPLYQDLEQTITVREGEMEAIGPLKLKVLQGLARIEAGKNAADALIILNIAGDRRALPTLPVTLEIDTSKPHVLSATKAGFDPYTQELQFNEGEAERTFEIDLRPKTEPVAAAPVYAAPSTRVAPTPAAAAAVQQPAGPAVGKAALNINSIPRTSVLLDGKPLGSTPRVGIAVPPGRHTIVFIKGNERKSASVNVKAGETRTVAIRF